MNEIEKLSYAMGMNMAEYLGNNPLPIDKNAVIKGMSDTVNGKAELSNEEYVQSMQKLQQMMQQAGKDQFDKIAAEHAEAEKKFMTENAKRPEVKTTESGLQYEIVSEGKGAKPLAKDTVRVHYVGTLLNGDEFDSSVRRGEPAEFGVGQVIAGWTEALQMMNVGSKYKLYIPARLAYGERGAGQSIPPNAALVFEVELLDIVK